MSGEEDIRSILFEEKEGDPEQKKLIISDFFLDNLKTLMKNYNKVDDVISRRELKIKVQHEKVKKLSNNITKDNIEVFSNVNKNYIEQMKIDKKEEIELLTKYMKSYNKIMNSIKNNISIKQLFTEKNLLDKELYDKELNNIKKINNSITLFKERIKNLQTYIDKRSNIQSKWVPLILNKPDITKKEINDITKNIKKESKLELKKIVSESQNILQNKLDNLNRKFEELKKEKNRNRIEPPKKIEKEIIRKEEEIKDVDRILRELRENRSAGTVASIGGFLGITTASIIARIIGNSTANYLSPHHKSTNNIVVGDKKDDKQKLIDLILQKRSQDLSELKNDIDHLQERLDDDEKKKNRRSKKTIMHRHKTRNNINLINVINRI